MAGQLAALVAFVGIFTAATLRKVHLGILMFAAACGAGIWLADLPLADVIAGFPLGILVLLVGVTYFFGVAQVNGTIDGIIDATLAKVGERTALLPPVFFVLTGGISAMGSPLGGLVMAPIGMAVADRRGLDPMLMGLAMGTGLSAGGFAPSSLFGIVTYGTAHAAGIELSPFVLFAAALVVNVVLFGCAYCMFGRLSRRSRHVTSSVPAPKAGALASGGASSHGPASTGGTAGTAVVSPGNEQAWGEKKKFTRIQVCTLFCMLGLVGAVIVLSVTDRNPDIGVLAFAFGAVLAFVDPKAGKQAVTKIDWSTVLLVGGIITYVGVLEHMGAVDLLGEFASSLSVPLLAALFICLVAGLVSAFASTTGMLAALVPLALPLVSSGDIPGWALICALGICASIVDVSPFSTVGATLVASTVDERQRPRMTRLLTRWGLSMVVLGPLALVGALVLPGVLL
ncbi:SLC13 family permease [Streptomyces sp. JV185]|uniref:SLC13 family permease n=1 Tax=Streptomyces sp. JV185 TaxID=858638 RepID=UPI002E7969E4|nr:SLC13 family permease [Streptomyces sp. JV185]MEE1770838.1 SLC13 family permease [Streptomyces sp. JV185]